MHLSAIWSGNFHQLRNSLGGHCSTKLLQFHMGVNHGKVGEATRWNLRPLATKIQGRNQSTQSANVNINTSNNTEYKALRCFDLQQKFSDNKIIDRPATMLVFDIETTGFNRPPERIIEIALRDLIGGKNSTFQTLINPEKIVRNSDIHGISSRMVNRPDVPRFEELIPILLKYVRSRQMDGKPVLLFAHNGRRFDVPFMIREFHRCSMEIPDDWLFVDTLPLARQLVNPDGSKLASFSLNALREHYGIPLVGPAHRAMQDVMTLSYVLQRLTFDLKLTIPELIEKAFRASDLTKVAR